MVTPRAGHHHSGLSFPAYHTLCVELCPAERSIITVTVTNIISISVPDSGGTAGSGPWAPAPTTRWVQSLSKPAAPGVLMDFQTPLSVPPGKCFWEENELTFSRGLPVSTLNSSRRGNPQLSPPRAGLFWAFLSGHPQSLCSSLIFSAREGPRQGGAEAGRGRSSGEGRRSALAMEKLGPRRPRENPVGSWEAEHGDRAKVWMRDETWELGKGWAEACKGRRGQPSNRPQGAAKPQGQEAG